ncbi:hypothetical protein LOC68_07555 [Blastopirellula sp. JC732]|uniref:Uncharacterized protein n=1 Tax=Blastopirellula sediminis TaxID=2894196 RepID=A0A9X1MKJ0_9BACT|nr:hypothetical protein [Blastopirellula sediminis]MCC9608977.1 hypothetical protein [Blastopirellula sediminis]MCC9628246.1 hypothetical protein [Blastopirellula sediminis]
MITQTAGPNDEVVKTLPPLTIAEDALDKGLNILADSVREVLGTPKRKPAQTMATADWASPS